MSAQAAPSTGALRRAPAGRLKRSRVSLIGGIGSGLGVAVLTVLLAGGLSVGNVLLGLAVGAALAIWVRLADL